MIKVKVTKNIIRNGSVIFGLTMKQLIMAGSSFVIGIILVLLLKDKMSMNALMGIVFTVILGILSFSIVQIQGLTLMEFIYLAFKGVDKRPYYIKGVFNNDTKTTKKER